jgi:hypothetical protein
MHSRGHALWLLILLLLPVCSHAAESDAVARGEKFLISLFDPKLDLLPEYRGSHTYWLFHDNYLAAKLLENRKPDLALRIRRAITSYGVTNSGKIEILFDETPQPLPFRHYQLINLAMVVGQKIRTEIVTTNLLRDWTNYADLLLLASIAQRKVDGAAARRDFDKAEALWDGKGLADRVVQKNNRYATYKLAFYLISEKKLGVRSRHAKAVRERLLLLQSDSGGWITDYGTDLKPVGLANVETTCLALLALHGTQ